MLRVMRMPQHPPDVTTSPGAGLRGEMDAFRSCCVAALTLLAGCGLSSWVADNISTTYDEYWWRDAYLASAPAGRPLVSEVIYADELVALYGPPDLVLEARPKDGEYRDGVPALSYIYKPRDGRKCYDTFVVIMETGKVARYHCR
jgi:hypothetical protein